MKQKIAIISLLCTFVFSFSIKAKNLDNSDTFATITAKDEQLLLNAEDYFDAENYIAAMSLFDTLCKHYPQSLLFKFNAGICYLHASSKHTLALSYLQEAKANNPDLEGVDYYLGRAYLYNYYYDEALSCFQKYNERPKHRNETKMDVSHFIDYCNNGKELTKNPVSVVIENIGRPVNTDNSEYVPVISSDESYMIFTYRGERSKGGKQNANNKPDNEGEYYEDIFISYRIGDHWLDPEPLGNINTNGHDAAIALSVDGQKLFVFKATTKDKGDIYISELKGSDWTVPQRLNKNVNTTSWEGSITMSNDEKTIYFSSSRPGGFGGRDLYKCSKQADGEWGPAQNLGPNINTKYNEDAPYIHPDSKLFYFSSEGHNSIGGYDIFKSLVQGDSLTAPLNLGFPINTSADDKYISVTTNGLQAFYSSGVDEGLGQQDIYSITPGILGAKPQVAVLKGKVKGNEKGIRAQIKVSNQAGNKDYGTFYSNEETGNYLLVLLPTVNYKIRFEKEGYPVHTEYISTSSIKKTIEVEQDIHLYTSDYALTKVTPRDSMGFIYSKLEEEVSKLDNSDISDDNLIAVARAQEAERRSGISATSASFRVATEATVKRIVEQNSTHVAVANQLDKPKELNEIALVETKISTKDSSFQDSSLNASKTNSSTLVNSGESTKPLNKNVSELTTNKLADSLLYNRTFGVYYKVQIGAYRHPKNFKYAQISNLATVEKLLLKDGITRFTMGNFETLAEANQLRSKVIEKGIKDAWITATVNGERKLLDELSAMNLNVIN